MRKHFIICIALLSSVAAAGAWAQEVKPKPPRIGDARVFTPVPAAVAETPAVAAPAPAAVLPDLRGKTCEQAAAELRRLHVALTECRPGTARIRYPAGTINAQSHPPGTVVSRVDGLRVTFEPVPATDRSSDSTATPVPRPSPDPGAGNAADAAAALIDAIVKSRTPLLPDLRGKTCEQALAALRPLRIALAECVPGEARGRYAVGTINAQSYAPGTPASRVAGLRVRLEPLPPPPAETTVVLPDLRGRTCDQARAELQRLRIAPAACLPGDSGGAYPVGTINAQSPAPGTPAARVDGLRVWIEPSPPVPKPEPRLVLPDLRGKTCDDAARELAGLRLKYASCAAGEAVANVRPGHVNAQSPEAGTALPLAGPLVLRVQPAPMVIVPALVGLGEAQARSALASRRLQAQASGPAAAQGRRVLRQSPAAGTAVAPATTVEIGLGLGVPRLLGLDCAAARARAAAHGHLQLECESRPAASPDDAIGRVFAQSPEADGAVLAAPATIRVTLWAAQPVTVPDVQEQSLPKAVGAIEAARLVARPDAQPEQRQGERIVVRQAPAPGTIVDAGSVVTLATREVVEVPDVVGRSLAAAQSALRQSRLRDAADAGDHADDRVVQSQSPAARARVAVDSAVQLSTARFATVPALGGMSCDEARAAVVPDTFDLRCDAEESWRVTAFGAPQVVAQQPAAQVRAEVGTTIVAEARAPLPAAAPWLGSVPLAAVAAVVAAPLLGLGLWFGWLRPAVPPAAPPGAAADASAGTSPVRLPLVPPLVPPPRAPTFEWRVDADAAPAVNLRWPAAAKGTRRGSRHAAPAMSWRVVPDAGHVLLRENETSRGGEHAQR